MAIEALVQGVRLLQGKAVGVVEVVLWEVVGFVAVVDSF